MTSTRTMRHTIACTLLVTLLALMAVIIPLDQITKSLVSAYIERGS